MPDIVDTSVNVYGICFGTLFGCWLLEYVVDANLLEIIVNGIELRVEVLFSFILQV